MYALLYFDTQKSNIVTVIGEVLGVTAEARRSTVELRSLKAKTRTSEEVDVLGVVGGDGVQVYVAAALSVHVDAALSCREADVRVHEEQRSESTGGTVRYPGKSLRELTERGAPHEVVSGVLGPPAVDRPCLGVKLDELGSEEAVVLAEEAEG